MGNNEQNPQERIGEIGSIGILQRVPPPPKIHHAGVLDFRGVPGPDIAKIIEISSADVVLLDEENRLFLNGVKMHHVRSVLVAAPEERVLVTAQLDLSRAAVEAMGGEQQLLVVGNVFIAPDTPAELIAAKFRTFRVIGTLTAGAGAIGALVGRSLFSNGAIVGLPEDAYSVTRLIGELRLTSDYLSELPDDTTYLNFGEIEIKERLDLDLLRRKIRDVYNLGEIRGERAALSVLRARCRMDAGEFENG